MAKDDYNTAKKCYKQQETTNIIQDGSNQWNPHKETCSQRQNELSYGRSLLNILHSYGIEDTTDDAKTNETSSHNPSNENKKPKISATSVTSLAWEIPETARDNIGYITNHDSRTSSGHRVMKYYTN